MVYPTFRLKEVCRLCSVIQPTLYNLFQIPYDLLLDKISICLPVRITTNDTVSTKICYSCKTKVEDFYEFWKNAARTQEYFQQVEKYNGGNAVSHKEETSNLTDPLVTVKEEPKEYDEFIEVAKKFQEVSECLANDKNDLVDKKDAITQTNPLVVVFKPNNLPTGPPGLTPINNQSSLINNVTVDLNKVVNSSNNNQVLPNTVTNNNQVLLVKLPSTYSKNNGQGLINQKPTVVLNNGQNKSISNLMLVNTAPSLKHGQVTLENKGFSTAINNSKTILLNQKFFPLNNKIKSISNIHFMKNGKSTLEKIAVLNTRSTLVKTLVNNVNSVKNIDFTSKNITESSLINKIQPTLANNKPSHSTNKLKTIPFLRVIPKSDLSLSSLNSLNKSTEKERVTGVSKAGETIEKGLKCIYCSKIFKKNSLLERHLITHGGKKPFRCAVVDCNKEFTRKSNLRSHTIKFHKIADGNYNICVYCQKSFKTLLQLKFHSRIHIGGKLHHCKQCNFTSFGKLTLEAHICRHTKPIFKCDTCDKTFNKKFMLQRHNIIHTGVTCKDCNQLFNTFSKLRYHTRKVHKTKVPICSYCNIVHSNRECLRRHIRKIHDLKFHCYECGKQILSRPSLIAHLRRHSGEKPFKCKICKERFFSKAILSQHNVLHSKIKKYICRVCKKSYTQKSSLNVHYINSHFNYVDDVSKFCEVKMDEISDK